ncbi:hypothetical protein ACOMHN_024693 [Nucella lapillus]
MLPVRWMSPESVKFGRFTSESDVWAYGVVLWEIFSSGRQPYYGHSNEEVVRFLDAGILLQRPEDCPSTIYHIMLGCWKADPRERHSFDKICKHLQDYHERLVKMAAASLPTTPVASKNELHAETPLTTMSSSSLDLLSKSPLGEPCGLEPKLLMDVALPDHLMDCQKSGSLEDCSKAGSLFLPPPVEAGLDSCSQPFDADPLQPLPQLNVDLPPLPQFGVDLPSPPQFGADSPPQFGADSPPQFCVDYPPLPQFGADSPPHPQFSEDPQPLLQFDVDSQPPPKFGADPIPETPFKPLEVDDCFDATFQVKLPPVYEDEDIKNTSLDASPQLPPAHQAAEDEGIENTSPMSCPTPPPALCDDEDENVENASSTSCLLPQSDAETTTEQPEFSSAAATVDTEDPACPLLDLSGVDSGFSSSEQAWNPLDVESVPASLPSGSGLESLHDIVCTDPPEIV